MFVVALVLSKLVLVVILLVAVTQVSAPIDADLSNIADPLAGVVLMALAGFAPYMTYKFVTFIGFDMYHSMSAEQEAKSALNRPVVTTQEEESQDGSGSGGLGGLLGQQQATPQPGRIDGEIHDAAQGIAEGAVPGGLERDKTEQGEQRKQGQPARRTTTPAQQADQQHH